MRRALAIAALVACGLLTARCATEGAAGDYYDPYYYDDPWYGYGFGWGVVIGGCCGGGDGGDVGPPPRPEHPIANPTPAPKAQTRPSEGSSSSRPAASPRAAAPSRGGGGGGRGGGGRR